MSFLNKLTDFVTGGGAEVKADLTEANLKSSFTVQIKGTPIHGNLKIDNVYLRVRCVEGKLIYFEAPEGEELTDNERMLNELKDWEEKTLFEERFIISGKENLIKGKEYTWSKEIDLTAQNKASIKSEKHFVKWEAEAGLDVPGNDPDSGWVEFEMK